jgi:hypothetical protein
LKANTERAIEALTGEFGKGFSTENLDRMRFFYKTYTKPISSTVLTKLNSTPLLPDFKLSWFIFDCALP